ncbi:hypothetical protein GPX89_01210 [Nocardia sp. ET3-3]|uniref:Serine hydrolase n=1 Tax=Nocardia terrae TaxID=2675851 RepID=A0A7K1UNG7_9NOCA|nr:hypothetical protein [Nocardia terrae]MVU75861.1 hypothetical protein [Nocardia terrae]
MLDDFAALRAQAHGKLGLALLPVGGNHPAVLGDWSSGVAWSTIKVPLAIAALRRHSDVSEQVGSAITASDNGAASALWQSLGTPQAAATAVEQVLHEAGDTTTDVADRHNPANADWASDSLAFGSTVWSLSDQVRFASRLPCLPQSASVLALMGKVVAEQSWGLGGFTGARFKGGWGPDDATGAYTERQFGLVRTHSGTLAVAVAALPDSGSFEDATLLVSRAVVVLAEHLGQLSGGTCP